MVQLIVLFIVAASLLTITPGVDTAMVLRTSTSCGPRDGTAASLGICLGLLAWGACSAFGLTALLAASELAFNILKWAGAAYLVYLGIKLLTRPRTSMTVDGASQDSPAIGVRNKGAFYKGFLSNILNPKVGVFYVTFLPQFIPHGIDVAGFSLLLASIHVLITLAWFALLIALTVPLGRFLSRPRVVRNLDRLTGCVFVGFGVKLAVAKRA
ncbi:MAG: LysE family translocator [Terracidiphilus sp.]|jgi:threonine/homoserine/homoserine lactone efflux protein